MFGGLSDPYIRIFTDPPNILGPGSELKSSIVKHNINPKWEDNLTLKVITSDYDGLSQNAHIFLTVWDYDLTKSDDLIGACSIPFRTFLDQYRHQNNKPYTFKENLYAFGRVTGQLQGTLAVVNNFPDNLRSIRKANPIGPEGNAIQLVSLNEANLAPKNSASCGCIIH